MAGTLLDGMQAVAPTIATEPLALAAVHGERGKSEVPETPLEHNRSLQKWAFCGPFPTTDVDAVLKAWGGPDAVHQLGDPIAAGGTTCELIPGDREHVDAAEAPRWEVDPLNLTLLDAQRRILPLGRILGPGGPRTLLLHATLRTDEPRTLRLACETPGVRLWIGGREVEHGDRLAFEAGRHPLLASVVVDEIPRDGLRFSPRFFASDDPAVELARWQARAERIEPYLRRALELSPDSPAAARARRLLDSR